MVYAQGQIAPVRWLKADGAMRYSWAEPPVPRDRNLLPDVYLYDRRTRCVTRVSGSPVEEWWASSVAPAISAAGNLVVFSSAQPAGPGDLRTDLDLFLFRPPGRGPFGSEGQPVSTSR